eukprot:jgi/Psemu1/282216/fgenesh1_pg.4_\
MTISGSVLHRIVSVATLALLGWSAGVDSFQARVGVAPSGRGRSVALAAESATTSKATLTEETTWTMRMNLENLPTTKGKRTGGIYVVQAQFVEEEGYEPPQGNLKQIFSKSDESADDADEEETASPSSSQMTISSGRWTLSEDPEDRKDSLWIWGLFKEPLYPFLLLQFEVEEMTLPGEEKDSIQPFKLFAQINHKRGDNGEVILASVTDLTVREKETIKADPFGAAKLDLFENVVVGKLQLQAQ